MPVAREYKAKVELPDEWGWQFLHDLEDLLTSKGFASRFVEWTASDGRVNASSTREMASEFPDPVNHTNFLFTMANGEPFSGETSVTFSSWGLMEDKPPSSVNIRISGNDETEVLGLREVLQKFADHWGPRSDDPEPTDLPSANSVEVVTPEMPDHPLWKQPWFWGAVGVLVAIVTLVVIIILAQ